MPNKTIYIRREDEAAWDALADKPGFIHQALASKTFPTYIATPEKISSTQPSVKIKDEPVTFESLENRDQQLCTGHPGMRLDCGKKNCKYASKT
jgi:hypothetical protein